MKFLPEATEYVIVTYKLLISVASGKNLILDFMNNDILYFDIAGVSSAHQVLDSLREMMDN
jgi:hypothetical protein